MYSGITINNTDTIKHYKRLNQIFLNKCTVVFFGKVENAKRREQVERKRILLEKRKEKGKVSNVEATAI